MAKAKRPQQRPQARRPAPGAGSGSGAGQQPKATKPTTPATPTGGSARLAAMRERTGTVSPQRKPSRYARKPWWRRNLVTLITVGVVVVAVGVFIYLAQQQNKATSVGVGDPVPADVLKAVTGVSPTVAAKVGDGGLPSALQATPKNTAVLTSNGKPVVIYVGADWCPYCAATRWSTVVALSRFGSFSGLALMRSSSSDVYPSTATFSFQGATYTSQYIAFSATETQDRNQNALATPPADASSAFSTYNIPPYTTQAGGIPFMSYGNQYVTTSTIFVPTMLQGLTWQQIAAKLNDPNSDVTKAIVGGANEQTAAICKLTNNQPGNVCNATEIQQLEAKLPQPK